MHPAEPSSRRSRFSSLLSFFFFPLHLCSSGMCVAPWPHQLDWCVIPMAAPGYGEGGVFRELQDPPWLLPAVPWYCKRGGDRMLLHTWRTSRDTRTFSKAGAWMEDGGPCCSGGPAGTQTCGPSVQQDPWKAGEPQPLWFDILTAAPPPLGENFSFLASIISFFLGGAGFSVMSSLSWGSKEDFVWGISMCCSLSLRSAETGFWSAHNKAIFAGWVHSSELPAFCFSALRASHSFSLIHSSASAALRGASLQSVCHAFYH